MSPVPRDRPRRRAPPGRGGRGCRLHYAARRDDAVAVADEIRSAGGTALVVGGDVSDVAAVGRFFEEIEEQAGPVDVLVSNAGVHRGGRIASLASDDFDLVVRTSLYGAFHCIRRAACSRLRASGAARSSIGARRSEAPQSRAPNDSGGKLPQAGSPEIAIATPLG